MSLYTKPFLRRQPISIKIHTPREIDSSMGYCFPMEKGHFSLLLCLIR